MADNKKTFQYTGAVYTTDTPIKAKELTSAKISNKLSKGVKSITSMRLFGIPYQFTDVVDPRYKGVSEVVGRRYVENICMNAPTCYIIPGKPVFLPNKGNKSGTGHALIKAANGDMEAFKSTLSSNPSEKLRYYDFQEDYCEYMKYVNVLCRTLAGFLELSEGITVKNKRVTFQQYDWKNYRWDKGYYTSAVANGTRYLLGSTANAIQKGANMVFGKAGSKKVKPDTTGADTSAKAAFRTNNFVQFYIDPSSNMSETMNNSTTQSQIKSAMDSASSSMKEFQFLTNSAGISMDGVQQFAEGSLSALDSLFSSAGSLGSVISRLATAGSAVIKGENISMPDIYDRSQFSREYTLDIHLKAPYGNKFAIYMDVLVPMMHLMALCIPRQSTSNTYGAPFLVKAFYPGVFNCNLGIVSSITFTKTVSPESWTTDGLPNEVDCSVQIQDLYSDMAMSPSTDPFLFINNGSLIDYLATVSGLSLIEPQLSTKAKMIVSSYKNAIKNIDDNLKAAILSSIEAKFSSLLSLT